MSKKSKKNGAAQAMAKDIAAEQIAIEAVTTKAQAATDLRRPDAAQTVATLQATILEDIEALIKMVDHSQEKLVRPFKRAAEDKLRVLGWAVLSPETAANMLRLNGGRAAEKAQREAEKAEKAMVAAKARAEKLAAEAQAKLEAAKARVASLSAKAGAAA